MDSSQNQKPLPVTSQGMTPWAIALIPSLLTFLLYLPVLNHPFVNWDDPPMVAGNPLIRGLSPKALWDMLTTFYAADWVPLTWFSLAVDFKLGNSTPMIYHLNNLLLHCLNTLLVFFVASKFLIYTKAGRDEVGQPSSWIRPAALLTALGFGLHPIHVESVAWASERKDVLYSFFYLLSLLVYLKYAASLQWNRQKYLLCLGLFILSLLSKTMAITLPFVFLLLDLWPLDRLRQTPRQVLMEKIPFLLAALLAGIFTAMAQSKAHALLSAQTIPWDYRIMNAFHSLGFYLWKLLAPGDMGAFYPILFTKTYSPEYQVSALAFLFISWVCFYFRRTKPYLVVAWFYYLITFSPVLGFIHTGGEAVMDHYAYLALLGPLFLLASVTAYLFSQLPLLLFLGGALLAGFMALGTHHQLSTWKDSVNLWENVLEINSPYVQDLVYERLGDAYSAQGRWDDVLRTVDLAKSMSPSWEMSQSLSKDPWNKEENRDLALAASLHALKGVALLRKNNIPDAAKEFEQDIHFQPDNAMGHGLLSYTYEKMNEHTGALREALEAIRLNPNLPGIYNSLGTIYCSLAQYPQALDAFQKAVLSDRGNLEYLLNLASVYTLLGQYQGSVETLKRAVGLQPQNQDLYQRLGEAYLKLGDKTSAQVVFDAGKKLIKP